MVPAHALQLTPSAVQRAFRVDTVEVLPPVSTARAPMAVAPADVLSKLFKGAIIFQKDAGVRIVPTTDGGSKYAVDYIEVRRNNTGFSVSSDSESKADLYVTNFRMTAPTDLRTSGSAIIGMDVEIDQGRAPVKKQGGKVRLTASFLQDMQRKTQPATPAPAPTFSTATPRSQGRSQQRSR